MNDEIELASVYRNVEDISVEWENNITELQELEDSYFKHKEAYENKSQEIIESTDFKALYGKNNESVRKNHVKNTLIAEYNTIHRLEREINHLKRRISFLKVMVYLKIDIGVGL